MVGFVHSPPGRIFIFFTRLGQRILGGGIASKEVMRDKDEESKDFKVGQVL